MKKLRVGTRGSKLALWQARWVAEALKAKKPDLSYEIVVIKTTGDHIQDVALSRIGDKGAFTKELEIALQKNQVDLVVHSMKDVPTTMPDGLGIVAMLPRANAHDALVSSQATSLAGLPQGARVGTGSLRRRAFLQAMRPDVTLVELRGNLDTRIAQVESGNLDAAILACAGLERMEWMHRNVSEISFDEMLPAVGQGAVGVEARLSDDSTIDALRSLDDWQTSRAVEAERRIMRSLEGGCQVPLAAHGRYMTASDGLSRFSLSALVCSLDGSVRAQASVESAVGEEERCASQVLDMLISQGAHEILDEVRRQFAASMSAGEVVYG